MHLVTEVECISSSISLLNESLEGSPQFLIILCFDVSKCLSYALAEESLRLVFMNDAGFVLLPWWLYL